MSKKITPTPDGGLQYITVTTPNTVTFSNWAGKFNEDYIISNSQSGTSITLDLTGAVIGKKVRIPYNGASIPTYTGATVRAYGTGKELINTPYEIVLTFLGLGIVKKEIEWLNLAPEAFAVSVALSTGAAIINPVVYGTEIAGQYGYRDYEDDDENTTVNGTIYRWKKNGVVISGQTTQQYTPVIGDVGADITFEVFVRALTGTQDASGWVTSPAVRINDNNIYANYGADLLDGNANGLADSGTGTPVWETINNSTSTVTVSIQAQANGFSGEYMQFTSTNNTGTTVLTLQGVTGSSPVVSGKEYDIVFEHQNNRAGSVRQTGNTAMTPSAGYTETIPINTLNAIQTTYRATAVNNSNIQFRMSVGTIGDYLRIRIIGVYPRN